MRNDNKQDAASIDSTLMALAKMRRQVELEKTELSKAQGRRGALEDRLRKDFGLRGGVDEARKRIRQLDDQLARRNKAIADEMAKLREKYDFGEL